MEAKRLKGFPVINLEDGTMIGKIQDLVVDPEEKRVSGLLVGEKGLLKGRAQVILYSQVNNIGRDAVTVGSREDITSTDEHPQLDRWKDYSFIGNGVINADGDYIARVKDFTFQTKDGSLEALLLYDLRKEEKGREIALGIEAVQKLGRDYVIVDSTYPSHLYEKEEESEELRGLSPLEKRAVEFALHKEAAHTVRDTKGETVVEKGEMVTVDTISKARRQSRLYQVLFAAGVGDLLENIDHTLERLDQGSQQLLEAWKSFQGRSRSFFRSPETQRVRESEEEGEEEEAEYETAEPEEPDEGDEEEIERQREEGFQNLKETWGKIEGEIAREGRELTQYSLERMKHYIVGKKVAHTIRDNQGHILAQRGETITEEIAEIAEAQGKVPALFLGVMAQETEESLDTIREKISNILQR